MINNMYESAPTGREVAKLTSDGVFIVRDDVTDDELKRVLRCAAIELQERNRERDALKAKNTKLMQWVDRFMRASSTVEYMNVQEYYTREVADHD